MNSVAFVLSVFNHKNNQRNALLWNICSSSSLLLHVLLFSSPEPNVFLSRQSLRTTHYVLSGDENEVRLDLVNLVPRASLFGLKSRNQGKNPGNDVADHVTCNNFKILSSSAASERSKTWSWASPGKFWELIAYESRIVIIAPRLTVGRRESHKVGFYQKKKNEC